MAEWKKVIVSGSSPEFGAITVDGTVTAGAFSGDGSGLTGVAAGSINIDGFTAGSTLDQADVFLYSDDGTEKKITFSNIEDEIFGNVSGDATIAAGGALTIANTAVTNDMLAGSIANGKLSNSAITIAGTSTSLGGSIAADDIISAVTSGQIANSQLSNSAITIAGNSTSLGGSITAATILATTGVLSGSAQIESEINDLADSRISAASVTDLTDVTSAGSGAIITSAERTKLGGIATGAQVNVDTNITVVESTNTVEIQSSTGTNDSIAAATTSKAGVMSSGDKSKLDGIEAGANVTDFANVQAAGALMDSEVSNLSAVKSFNPSDYATAAQGATADAALPASEVSAFGLTLIDDANASTARTTLGLGSIATLSSIDISSNTNLAAGTGVTLTGDTLSIGQSVGTSDNVTFANITATGDLMVQGTLTSLQTTNLNIEDQFILLNSGSADAQSQGIVFGGSTGTQGVGEAFFYDLDADRPAWSSNAVAWNATSAAETAFIPRVFDVDGSSHTPINEVGSIQVTGGEILIYA
jgi:hypothetical protein